MEVDADHATLWTHQVGQYSQCAEGAASALDGAPSRLDAGSHDGSSGGFGQEL
jgi:hypothetical protein